MRKRILAPFAAVLLTATLGSAAPAGDPPECVVAARWVRAHRGELPTTLGQFSRYSLAYRRAIYDVLPPATRRALWHEQLEGFLAPGQPFSDTQRAAIRDAIARFPALIGPGRDRAAAARLRDHLRTLFDQPTYKRVFVVLGPTPAQEPAGAAAKRPLCDCASQDDCPGTSCAFILCSSQTGCGLGGEDTCTGVCRIW
ncbi:MAG TPA: bacteriocin fulvocin C-related protein [Longimicrobium sp.]|nr:bacteriocin fulvocin C-related protein [Longimicrobium sp.]